MKSAIAFSLIAGAAAFAPAANKQAVSTSLAAFEDEIGVIAPTGFFDPLGFCKKADQAQFDRWRGVELKHGRVSSTFRCSWVALVDGNLRSMRLTLRVGSETN
jgi:hypothetical protein